MLELENFNNAYGNRTVLSDMSLRVRTGELFGFVGGNGAGKTMLGVGERDSGTVSFIGNPMNDWAAFADRDIPRQNRSGLTDTAAASRAGVICLPEIEGDLP